MERVTLNVEGQKERLDTWIAGHLPHLSRSRVQKLIEGGNITLNGRTCTDKKTRVEEGDRLCVTIPDTRPPEVTAEAIELVILYEDDELIVIDKPAGLVVHPAPGHGSGTLVNAILHHCPHLSGIGGERRPGIVHRLDKDTTGALVIAKTDRAHRHLQAQLKAKTARREYLALVHGAPGETGGTIDLPIGRHRLDRRKMAVVPEEKGGRRAVTHWELRERLGNYSLLRFRLETGRTHQIRVHSSQIGHPIVGDPVYGPRRSIGVNLPGQLLHAHRLLLQHPVTGETIETVAPPPPIFQKVLGILRSR